jgi:hypothetical protein
MLPRETKLSCTSEGMPVSARAKSLLLAMDLLYRKDEVILTAPTGPAADHIDGNTYHSSLGISHAKTQKPTVSPRVRKLLSNKTIMFVDEISMVDLSMLSTMNDRCNIARSLDRSSRKHQTASTASARAIVPSRSSFRN